MYLISNLDHFTNKDNVQCIPICVKSFWKCAFKCCNALIIESVSGNYDNLMCARDKYPDHTLTVSGGIVGRDPNVPA